MGATHDPNINIQIILDAAGLSQAGFGIPLLVGEITADERVLAFATPKDVEDALGEGDITSSVRGAVLAAMAQRPRPNIIKVGRKDEGESYVDALTAIEAEDPIWYGLAVESREATDIVAVSGWVESREAIFVAQNSAADWLTSDVPEAFEAIVTNERTALAFHDTDTAALDIAWLANRLAFNPDTRSAPWDCQIFGVSPYASSLTSGQRLFAMGNGANVMLPYGPVPAFIDAGINIGHRPLYELVTRDWFKLRLEEKVARTKINASGRGEKIPLGPSGVAILRPLVEAQFSEGIGAGHFVAGQTEVEFIAPTQADIDAQRIRATGRAQLAVSARQFEFTFNFQRTPVVEETD